MLSLWHKSGLVVQLICHLNGQQMKDEFGRNPRAVLFHGLLHFFRWLACPTNPFNPTYPILT
jgi:hypothetical protein